MALHILKSTEPVQLETIVVLIYGDPGAGKTSLAFSAHDPLLLDFDRGAYRSGFRGDSVPVTKWAEVADMTAKDLDPYRTIVVDTAGRCLDALATGIMETTPKMRGSAGQLSLQGFGALKSQFAAWLRQLRAFGKDVVLIAHGVEQKSGDDLILRPDMQGSSYGEVMKCADGVAYLRMIDRARTLAWDPVERYVGKNPAALDAIPVPNLAQSPRFLGELLDQIKQRIGQISAAGAAIRETVDGYRERIDVADAAALSALVPEANSIDGPAKLQVKALIASRAKALGATWKGDHFEVPDAKPADAAPEPVTRGKRGQAALLDTAAAR